VKGLLSLN